jgi:hypothetical protein
MQLRTMTDQEREISDQCRKLGIDQHGLGSIRNFIAAAFYHARLPGTLPADVHVVFNTAIRRATNRIACQGRDGNSRSMSHMLSRRAVALREAILHDDAILPGEKLGRWLAEVTEEHQEPALAVQKWIQRRDSITVDDVVLRLLLNPSVIITREEERNIPSSLRRCGDPGERYTAAGIEIVNVEQGTASYFASHLWPGRRQRRGQYHVDPKPFDDSSPQLGR